ncbi:hypothetical protein [Porphyromonas gingivalis]|uniref:hypothetical protein n=1 Tax=Porphyromonas gingivalis TaxID=837 RepID=UPI001B8D55EF|nr:hypothetical protein [Porphyromonas gingivalis]
MCRLPKIAVFEFFVSKLIGLDLAKIGKMAPWKIKEFDQKLSDYTMTRYMKLLYFLCLVDAKGGDGGTNSGEGLLSIFNNFVAYQRGPVEEDIYRKRHEEEAFVLFTYEQGCLKLKQGSDSSSLLMVQETNQEAVANALEVLGQCHIGDTGLEKNILEEKEDTVLVELSHNLSKEVWPDAFYYSEKGGKISKILEDAEIRQKEITAFFKKTHSPGKQSNAI